MTDALWIAAKCGLMIIFGILAGNGAVYCFNKIPAQWLCDYGEEPSEELRNPYTQRVKSYPWKYVFTKLFIILGIKMVMDDVQFAVAGICALWLLLEMSIADVKYRIVPDQFILLLAVTALGFIPFHFDWLSCLFGCLTGFGVMGFTALAGRLISRKDAVGGGDIKLFSALGLIAGPCGIIFIFAATALLSGAHVVYMLVRRKITVKSHVPMVPYIAIAAGIYIVFFCENIQILNL